MSYYNTSMKYTSQDIQNIIPGAIGKTGTPPGGGG